MPFQGLTCSACTAAQARASFGQDEGLARRTGSIGAHRGEGVHEAQRGAGDLVGLVADARLLRAQAEGAAQGAQPQTNLRTHMAVTMEHADDLGQCRKPSVHGKATQ